MLSLAIELVLVCVLLSIQLSMFCNSFIFMTGLGDDVAAALITLDVHVNMITPLISYHCVLCHYVEFLLNMLLLI